MSAKMDNNQTNETKKSIWGESKRESKIMFIGAWGCFSVTIIDLIIDYNRVVENVRNSALMLGFLVAILGYLSELRYRLFPDLQND
jgi:hypothetical protein